jgi:hypothetical protein
VAFAAVHAHGSYTNLKNVLPGHTYYIKKRSHKKGYTLDDGWTGFSSPIKCTAPKAEEITVEEAVEQHLKLSVSASGFPLQVVRESRKPTPDYLQEHNAANLFAEAQFLERHAHKPISQLQIFCVDVMHATISGQTTSKHKNFANYASCQKLGSASYKCAKINDADCAWLKLNSSECKAARTAKSWENSQKYVGLGEEKTKPALVYSFPAMAECVGSEAIGDKKKDGTVCSWKIQEHFRLARGNKGMTGDEIQHAIDSAPLKKWECGNNPPPSAQEAELEVLV